MVYHIHSYEVARQSGVPIRLERVRVQTHEQAEAYRFLGSPTVQVNGVELDPGLRGQTAYGFA